MAPRAADDRWQLPERDSLCGPYGISHQDDVVAAADSGNKHVVLGRLAEEVRA